jgi:predicted ABC-type ATPase
MPAQLPTIYVIAGCNGAGKTTFAREFLPKEVKCLRFLNADEIAVWDSRSLPAKRSPFPG